MEPRREREKRGLPAWRAYPREMRLEIEPQSKILLSGAFQARETFKERGEDMKVCDLFEEKNSQEVRWGSRPFVKIRPQSLESELVQISTLSFTGGAFGLVL